MQKLLVIVLLSLPFQFSPAFSSDQQATSKCASILNSVDRLACYDEIFQKKDRSKSNAENISVGKWEISSTLSKIDDKLNVTLLLTSDNEISDRYGHFGNAILVIACREAKTDMYFNFANNFMTDNQNYGEVIVRLDKAAARTVRMRESTDNKALGLWNGAGTTFIKTMIGAQRLLARAVPFNENPVDVEFTITGLEEAIKPLRKACNW